MNKKQWILLFCLFALYLLLGAAIFFYIESEEEILKLGEERDKRKNIAKLLKLYYKGNDTSFFKQLTDYCGKPLDFNMGDVEDTKKWDFYHSLFFVITVVSTIGYGNLAPTTTFTRIFMIFYGLIGIPLNGIVMVSVGNYFGRTFTKLYQRWKTSKMQIDTTRLGLISQIILYAVPGFIFFIFLPSTFMVFFEGWAYDVAVYYSFVTLTTIGFGDYVAGVNNEFELKYIWWSLYQTFLVIWVIGGLGYVLMVLGFITRGLQSKKIKKLEHVLYDNIKKTPNKIRKELRTLLHEFLFLKVKPVYKGEFEYIPNKITRSSSCPDIALFGSSESPSVMRKRAFSECPGNFILGRNQSDTELDRIDKEKTFSLSDAFIQQKDLLVKVVDALSYQSDASEDSEYGINLFSDEDILASERFGSSTTLAQNTRKRRRAFSDIRPLAEYKPDLNITSGNTWYGTDAAKNHSEFRSRTFSMPVAVQGRKTSNLFQRIKNRFKSKEEENVDVEKQNYLQNTYKGRTSIFSNAEENYLRQTRKGRQSVLSNYQESVLEQTSIADFIRALSAITVPETSFVNVDAPKTRKYGVAGLPQSPTVAAQTRSRRMPIRANYNNRRSSMMPSQTVNENVCRRFSLRPVEENFSFPPPPYTPPSYENQSHRKFSVRPTNLSFINTVSPVQRQVIKRERGDSVSEKK